MRWQIPKSLFILMLSFAQPSIGEAQDSSYAKDYSAAKKFQQALRKNDRRSVAALVRYPMANVEPLASIKNAHEFIARWDESFDATNTQALFTAEAQQYGWRGIALLSGTVWFEKGKIRAINSQTAAYKKALQAAIKRDSARLYLTARFYDEVSFQCRTKDLTVRAQKHGADLRYFAWKVGASLLTKPELEMTGGKYDPQGTGGNYNLEFNNNGFTYSLMVGHYLCGEDCKDYLVISQGDKQLSNDVCTEISR